ncbi:MAG: 3'-5' exonuclease [Cyanobacteria bacterium J06626_23]
MSILEDYYLVVDLEATCADDKSIPRKQMEIIEIGAVMLHARSLQIESEFQSFIRPVVHPQLTPFCTALTRRT